MLFHTARVAHSLSARSSIRSCPNNQPSCSNQRMRTPNKAATSASSLRCPVAPSASVLGRRYLSTQPPEPSPRTGEDRKNDSKQPPASSSSRAPLPTLEDYERMKQEELIRRLKKSDSARGLAPISWWSVLLLLLLGGAVTLLLWKEGEERKKKRKSVGTPKIGGSWTLVDMNGVPRTDHEFRGKYQLIYFGFTFCPDICPVELKKIADVITEVEAKGYGKWLQPLFITVDPQRDSVYQVREYIKEFHPSFLGLTGTPQQVADCARAFRVYSMPGLEADASSPDYLVDHSVIIYFIGPDSKLVEYFGSRQSSAEISQKVIAELKNVAPRTLLGRLWDGLLAFAPNK